MKEARLNFNENPFGFPKDIFVKVAQEMDGDFIARYTEAPTSELREELVEYIRETGRADFINGDWITVTPGADGGIQLLMDLRPKRVVLFPPTYFYYYTFAEGMRLHYEEYPLIDDMHVPEVELKEGDMVFIPNPNNPTGHLFTKEEIIRLLESPAIVVVDEAYFEFSWVTSVQLLKDFENLVVLRTFSKAFAFAGQRFGYIIANPIMMERIEKVRDEYNMSSFIMKLAVEILRNREIFLGKIKEIEMERKRLSEELEKLGIKVFPSQTNFLYFKVKDAPQLQKKLAERKVYVRALWGGVRVTVGKREENDMFLTALKEILK